MPHKTKLSPREQEVVELAGRGLADKEIQQQMGVTENTLKTYWKRIRAKLGDASRPGLVATYVRENSGTSVARDIPFEADWVYDWDTKIWRHVSARPLPGNLQINTP